MAKIKNKYNSVGIWISEIQTYVNFDENGIAETKDQKVISWFTKHNYEVLDKATTTKTATQTPTVEPLIKPYIK